MSNINSLVAGFKGWKSAKTAELVKMKGEVFYYKRMFDPHTGTEGKPQILPIDIDSLRAQRQQLVDAMAAYDEFISEYDQMAKVD